MFYRLLKSINSLLLNKTRKRVELGIFNNVLSRASDADLFGSKFGQTMVNRVGDKFSAATSMSDSS